MRRRNMYYATGLPGWMRFGYSPGWVGRSPSGLGPCAEYMMAGQWPTPQMAAAWEAMQGGQMPMAPYGPWAPPGGMGMPWAGGPAMGFQPDPQAQLGMLKQQAEMLEQQLKLVRQQIDQADDSE